MTSEATDPALNGRTVGHVFISYSSSDRAIVNAAARLLRAGGATVFQDVVDIEFGARWKDALFDALNRCERVMVFWSAASSKSTWVEREWRCALEAHKRIVPMLLDDTPLPPPLSDFHGVPDMVDMLRADMKIAPAGEPAHPASGVTAPTASSGRSHRRVFAAVGSLATLLVVMAAWMSLQFRIAPQADPSRGPTDAGASNAPGEFLAYGWGLLVGLSILLVFAGTLYLKALRKRAEFSNDDGNADLGAQRSAELSAIGRRFTSALFDQPSDLRQGPFKNDGV